MTTDHPPSRFYPDGPDCSDCGVAPHEKGSEFCAPCQTEHEAWAKLAGYASYTEYCAAPNCDWCGYDVAMASDTSCRSCDAMFERMANDLAPSCAGDGCLCGCNCTCRTAVGCGVGDCGH